MAVRVVLGEDSYLVREGVRRLLDARPSIEVVATCGDLDSLRSTIADTGPDVVVTDIRMPPAGADEGIRLADELRVQSPQIGVVILSQFDDPAFALGLLRKGSAGRAYLLKERVHDIDELVTAIATVAAGGSVIDARVVERLVAAHTPGGDSKLAELTSRERDILAQMAQGKSNAAIAGTLVLAESSVEKYITSIFAKLGLTWERDVHRRVKAVLLYLAEQSAGSAPADAAADGRPPG